MCHTKPSAALPSMACDAVSQEALPDPVREALEAAETLYLAIKDHAPHPWMPEQVERQWKHLGECLAWWRR